MKLFQRKRAKISDEAIAGKIAAGILHYQRSLSSYLNQRTKGWTPKFRLGMMLGCCMLFGSYFLYVLAKALQNL